MFQNSLNTNGTEISIGCNYLIESIPIVDLISLLYPVPPNDVLGASSNLRYRSQVYLFITLDIDKITDFQCIYFFDRDIPFARISEMKNFSINMSPQCKSSIFVEFFCNEGDKIYPMDAEELFQSAIPYFEKYNFFKRRCVRNYYRFEASNIVFLYILGKPLFHLS